MLVQRKWVIFAAICSFVVAPSRAETGAYKSNTTCGDYCAKTGCSWTLDYTCPWAKAPGPEGRAKDDGSTGFNCCCVQRTSESQLCGGGKTPYSEEHARMFATLSAISYCPDKYLGNVYDWSCKGCLQSRTPLVPSKIKVLDVGEENATRILIGKLRDQAGCLMAFRGSSNAFNWKRDLEYASIIPADYEDCEGCEVHSGFYTVWKNVRGPALQAIRDVGCGPMPDANSGNPDNMLYVTGHSFGAALTELAMFTLQNHGFNVVKTYMFEAPRVGNKAFADAFASRFERQFDVFRITHAQDPVVHLPPAFLGFEHVQTEVFYDRKGNYKVCVGNEDPGCADQFWNIPDMLLHHSDDHCTVPLLDFGNICWPNHKMGLCNRAEESHIVIA